MMTDEEKQALLVTLRKAVDAHTALVAGCERMQLQINDLIRRVDISERQIASRADSLSGKDEEE